MCGIAGFISSDPKYDSAKIVREMLATMRHRGPDQTGVYKDGFVTLGMTRLNIVDNEKHDIPYESFDKSVTVVYNGEIYNHDSLRGAYGNRYEFKTKSDAETVLYHYIGKGVKSFEDYNGMYAFALYDRRKKEVFVVRDKAGEKPLYYCRTESFFAFASEIKAFFVFLKPVFNKECVSYSAYEFNVGEETLFKNIYSLLPGEYLSINRAMGVRKNKYWKIWDNLIDIPDNLPKIEKNLTELIVDAIKLRTKNRVHPYGTFISGGVDSALIACIAKPDYLYTCHYAMDDYNELEYAKLVSKKTKKRLIIVSPTAEDFKRTRKSIIYHLDTPCTWTSFSLWMLLERAHKDVRVILSGDGADEIFAGYHRYHLLHHDDQVRQLKALEKYSYLIDRYYGSAAKRYAKLVNRCENRYDTKVIQYLEKIMEFYFEKMNNNNIHAMGVADFYTSMQELLQFADRINMSFSVENRSPFLDYRLIQFAFSIPAKYKLRNGTTKWILKRIAKKFIPVEITERIDKRGFSAPVNRWFGWDKKGKYDRSEYKRAVYNDWKKVFKVANTR
ncbi:MAG: asparagine synthase (glutamine-hydrolyzing) [Candidatus Omnitrophica bacterium]|nr:asparagine synthase (glutamine-hydrolyzing) [Candidatus Omnitrophota bacterium]